MKVPKSVANLIEAFENLPGIGPKTAARLTYYLLHAPEQLAEKLSKAAADLLLFAYFRNHNFPLVMIRSTNVYGAHQQLFKIFPRTVIKIKSNKKLGLHGGGRAV